MPSESSPSNSTPAAESTGTSQRKTESNRSNAELSTGPKSVEGKKSSSRNATKHGLLINDVVISNYGGKEDQAGFDALLAELRDFYKPENIVEDLLVREMAVSYWKSARALRCERGAGTVIAGVQTRSGSGFSSMEMLLLELNDPKDALESLLQSSRGVDFLLMKVEEAAKTTKSTSPSVELDKWLGLYRDLNKISRSPREPYLAALDKVRAELTELKARLNELGSREHANNLDCSAIPSKGVLDRIHRYETCNVRHRYKLESRLEQVQARRREDAKQTSRKNIDVDQLQSTDFYETKPNGHANGGLPPNNSGAGEAEQE